MDVRHRTTARRCRVRSRARRPVVTR
jgi:hypothetical protein